MTPKANRIVSIEEVFELPDVAPNEQ